MLRCVGDLGEDHLKVLYCGRRMRGEDFGSEASHSRRLYLGGRVRVEWFASERAWMRQNRRHRRRRIVFGRRMGGRRSDCGRGLVYGSWSLERRGGWMLEGHLRLVVVRKAFKIKAVKMGEENKSRW